MSGWEGRRRKGLRERETKREGGGGDRKNKGDRQRERKRSPTDLIVKFLSFL